MRKVAVSVWLMLMAGLAPCVCFPAARAGPRQATIAGLRPPDGDAEMQELLGKLSKLGELAAQAKDPGEIVRYNLQLADVLGQLVAESKPQEQVSWLRQLADCLQVAAVNSPAYDKTAYQRLLQLETEITGSMPGSDLAAYFTFREMETEYVAAINQPAQDLTQTQKHWHERLVRFVETYPQAQDAPEAWIELAMVSESLGRKADAEKCYQHLLQEFPHHPLAAKAQSALHWLDLEGQPLFLALPLLQTDNERCDMPFDIDRMRGHFVVVYFWANSGQNVEQDFFELQRLLDRYGRHGLKLLCVNMDQTPEQARSMLHGFTPPGIHLFQRGGLAGRVAMRCGITAFPSWVLVGPDGRVVARTNDMSTLKDQIDKYVR